MLSKWPFWVSGLIAVAFLLFGCTPGRNEATPTPASPTPTKAPQQGALLAAPSRTMGHTEAHGGGGLNPDEREHCFQKDDTRDLVLTYTSDDDLTNSTVSAFLINSNDISAPFVVEDIPSISVSGKMATIKFSDALVPGALRTTGIVHLGPGPYTEVTIVDPTGGTGPASAAPKLRTGDVYRYDTVGNAKKDCQ